MKVVVIAEKRNNEVPLCLGDWHLRMKLALRGGREGLEGKGLLAHCHTQIENKAAHASPFCFLSSTGETERLGQPGSNAAATIPPHLSAEQRAWVMKSDLPKEGRRG